MRCRADGRDKESVFRLDIPLLCDKIRNDKDREGAQYGSLSRISHRSRIPERTVGDNVICTLRRILRARLFLYLELGWYREMIPVPYI